MVGESDKFPRSCHAEVEMNMDMDPQALLIKAQEYVAYMARESPLRESWGEFVLPDSTLSPVHLKVGVISLTEAETPRGPKPRTLNFLLSSLCADWRIELHADLITALEQNSYPEFSNYLRLKAKFRGK
jgi:hypothetical protein